MKVSSLAVVSPKNKPLYISTFDASEDESVRLQIVNHTSLDVVQERISLGFKTTPTAPSDSFLGLVSVTEGYKVYGLVSNTKVVFLVSTNDLSTVKEEDARRVLLALQSVYVDTVSNPFYEPDSPLSNSSQFTSRIDKLINAETALH